MQELPLDEQVRDRIESDLGAGRKLLAGIHPEWNQEDPDTTMSLLKEEIAKGTIFMPEAVAILVDCLRKATDWKLVTLKGSFTGTAMVSPDGAYATYPELVVGKAFRNPEESTIALYFNMIKGANLPPSEPGAYTILS